MTDLITPQESPAELLLRFARSRFVLAGNKGGARIIRTLQAAYARKQAAWDDYSAWVDGADQGAKLVLPAGPDEDVIPGLELAAALLARNYAGENGFPETACALILLGERVCPRCCALMGDPPNPWEPMRCTTCHSEWAVDAEAQTITTRDADLASSYTPPPPPPQCCTCGKADPLDPKGLCASCAAHVCRALIAAVTPAAFQTRTGTTHIGLIRAFSAAIVGTLPHPGAASLRPREFCDYYLRRLMNDGEIVRSSLDGRYRLTTVGQVGAATGETCDPHRMAGRAVPALYDTLGNNGHRSRLCGLCYSWWTHHGRSDPDLVPTEVSRLDGVPVPSPEHAAWLGWLEEFLRWPACSQEEIPRTAADSPSPPPFSDPAVDRTWLTKRETHVFARSLYVAHARLVDGTVISTPERELP